MIIFMVFVRLFRVKIVGVSDILSLPVDKLHAFVEMLSVVEWV